MAAGIGAVGGDGGAASRGSPGDESASCSVGGSDGGGGILVAAAQDMWALGATLCELLSGCPLLPANDEAHFASLFAKLKQLGSR